MDPDRLLVLDRARPHDWRVGDLQLEVVVACALDQVAGEFAAVVWGEPPFAVASERLGALGAPRVLSTVAEVVAAGRALGLRAHRVRALHPAVLRRLLADDPDLVAVPAGTVDLATGEVWGDRPGRLTETERRLFGLLVRTNGPVDREVLDREVFDHGPSVVSRAVDTAVVRLRRKIGADCIVTAYGRGYHFIPAEAASTAPPPPPRVTRRHQLGASLVDLDRRAAWVGGVERPLTEQNVRLIELLEEARPGSVQRSSLARALGLSDRAVTDAVRRLRAKLEDPEVVVSCAGGYRLGPEPARIDGPTDRRLLAILGAFAGAFPLEAAAELVGDAELARELVDRGLLVPCDGGRYRPSAAASPPRAAVWAHARWATRLAREALEARGRPGPLPDLADLLRAHDALLPTDPESAGVVAAAGALLVDLPPEQRLAWIERGQRFPPTRSAALLWVARAATEMALGRHDDAERSALEGCRTEPTVASAFTSAHLLALRRGDAEAALARLDEAEARFPPGAKPMSRASIARERAWWQLRRGDPAEAQRIALEAIASLAAEVRAPGHALGRRNRGVVEVHGHLLQVLAVALRDQGHLGDALEAADEAVTELATLPRRAPGRMARMTRSEVLAALGRLTEARAEIDEVLAEAEQLGHVEHTALAAAHQLSLAAAGGDLEAARQRIAVRGPAIRAVGFADAVAILDRASASVALGQLAPDPQPRSSGRGSSGVRSGA